MGLGACFAGYAPAQDNPAAARPKEGDFLVKVGDATNTPLAPSDIPLDQRQIMAWSMDPADKTVRSGSRLNRVMLNRIEPDKLSAETKARAADGVVAYSAICPHTGCEVTEWVPEELALFCPCHSSKFNTLDGGKVTDGPAPKALPALPLKVADGKLVVAAPFTSKITFEQG